MHECASCGMVFIKPRFADARTYYREQYRSQHESTLGKRQTPEERGKLQYDFARKTAEAFKQEVPAGASVLEIGCSAGGFLAHLQGAYDCYGNEWNPADAAYVRDIGGIPCEEGDLADVFKGKTFTAIAAMAVLEHQTDPLGFLRTIRERLVGGGYLYLEVPNYQDALRSMYQLKAFDDFDFREPHITYWKPQTLAALLNVAGFEASINWKQKYSFHNHVNWILNGKPMDDPVAARNIMLPVPRGNPGAPALNRIWDQLEQEYRVQMTTLFCADTLTVSARRMQI